VAAAFLRLGLLAFAALTLLCDHRCLTEELLQHVMDGVLCAAAEGTRVFVPQRAAVLLILLKGRSVLLMTTILQCLKNSSDHLNDERRNKNKRKVRFLV